MVYAELVSDELGLKRNLILEIFFFVFKELTFIICQIKSEKFLTIELR